LVSVFIGLPPCAPIFGARRARAVDVAQRTRAEPPSIGDGRYAPDGSQRDAQSLRAARVLAVPLR
jgi:hypothetical protein